MGGHHFASEKTLFSVSQKKSAAAAAVPGPGEWHVPSTLQPTDQRQEPQLDQVFDGCDQQGADPNLDMSGPNIWLKPAQLPGPSKPGDWFDPRPHPYTRVHERLGRLSEPIGPLEHLDIP